MTFRQCAEAYIEAHKSSWANAKHAAQWPSTLTAYAYPILGHLPVQPIDVALVTKALEPIWQTKTETALLAALRGVFAGFGERDGIGQDRGPFREAGRLS
jgi:hypothetical protein